MFVIDAANKVQRARQRLRVLHGEIEAPDWSTRYLLADNFARGYQHTRDIFVVGDFAVSEAETKVDLECI